MKKIIQLLGSTTFLLLATFAIGGRPAFDVRQDDRPVAINVAQEEIDVKKSPIEATVLLPKVNGYCRYRGRGTDVAELVQEKIKNLLRRNNITVRLSASGGDYRSIQQLQRERRRENPEGEVRLGTLDIAVVSTVSVACNVGDRSSLLGLARTKEHTDLVTINISLIRVRDEIVLGQGEGRRSNKQSFVIRRGVRPTFSFEAGMVLTPPTESVAQQALNDAALLKQVELLTSTPYCSEGTHEDVISLVKEELPESLILSKIRLSSCKFNASTESLIKLKKAGASDAVLQLIFDSASK